MSKINAYEQEIVEKLGNREQEEIAGWIIAILDANDFFSKKDLDGILRYSDYDLRVVLAHLIDYNIIVPKNKSVYPKGVIKGYRFVAPTKYFLRVYLDENCEYDTLRLKVPRELIQKVLIKEAELSDFTPPELNTNHTLISEEFI